MKRLLFILISLVSFVCYAAGGSYNTVVVISVDALHPDAVGIETCPNIFRLAENGLISRNALSTDPPKTLIAHTAMLTGMPPEKNGKKDNDWKPGDGKVTQDTLLSYAKSKGYATALIYSKKKLGYLGRDADREIFSAEDAVDAASSLLDTSKKQFIFLHISGLDTEGPVSGWMSAEYMDEFNFIDEQLGSLFEKIKKSPSSLIVVTSDHAGHEKIHGSDHPEDYKRPLIIFSSKERIKDVPESALKIDGLKGYLETLF
ncbi:MAG: alkaline phosphatase family protein [Deferribacterales bacterium]